jgi:hypothetical protein
MSVGASASGLVSINDDQVKRAILAIKNIKRMLWELQPIAESLWYPGHVTG